MIGIAMKVEGVDEAMADLTRFMDVVRQPFLSADLVEDLNAEFHRAEREQFKTEGAFGSGAKWAPLSQKYGAWKRRHYPGKTILRREDRLYRSLTRKGADESIVQIGAGGQSLTLGTVVEYATYHQTGTRKMRARPPVEFQKDQAVRFMKIVHRHVVKQQRLLMKGWTVEDIAKGMTAEPED